MNEFELIRQYFSGLSAAGHGVVLGIGDDAALLQPSHAHQLVVTTDTLVEGRHFRVGADAADLGWKSLAVNLSDLAAMGAEPRWFTLALTLPAADAQWLTAFSRGLGEMAGTSGITLVGGDTTRGPLSITITVHGEVPNGMALRRSGARSGDEIFVSGSLGDAAFALDHPDREGTLMLAQRLHRPTPRIALGMALRGIAHAAIDISDGLAQDLGHVLAASGVGAELQATCLPSSPALATACHAAERTRYQLAGGDDYELCVCMPPGTEQGRASTWPTPLTRIGRIVETPGLRVLDAQGATMALPESGYQHFT